MNLVMAAKRPRVTVDAEPEVKRAFEMRASLEGILPKDLFARWVAEHCPDELAAAKRYIRQQDDTEGTSSKKPPAR